MQKLVVTRHAALVAYLKEVGLVDDNVVVLPHVKPEDVEGRHVVGVLPLRLAALAASVTEVQLDLPQELRGVELTLDQVRQYAGKPEAFVVRLKADDDKLQSNYCDLEALWLAAAPLVEGDPRWELPEMEA
jgi:putative CRISPR-associated protein (TIGR02620 family)